MKSLHNLYLKETERLKQWQRLVLSHPKRQQFLIMVIPLMDYVYSCLNQFIMKNHPELRCKISEEFLQQFIHEKFIRNVNLMIIRICVLEMHLASKHKLLKGITPEARFNSFIKLLKNSENSLFLLNKYDVLKKRLTLYVEQLIHAYKELFHRLALDQAELTDTFFDKNKSFYLTYIYSSGDAHHQGREVVILEFSDSKSTKRIVYKPHSLAVDVAFQNFIQWFNKEDPILKLYVINIIAKKDYGWSEYITYEACGTKIELKEFYFRMGVLLMLAYFFNAFDIHAENIIAHGAYPVIVDYECLLLPFIPMKSRDNKKPFRTTVVNIEILPKRKFFDKTHKGVDDCALGIADEAETEEYYIQWLDIGKDTMHAERRRLPIESSLNRPKMGEKNIDFTDYKNDFLQGFERAYYCILKHRKFFLSADSLLNNFRNIQTRLVFRNTGNYAKLLYESWHPKLLFDSDALHGFFFRLNKITTLYPYYAKLISAELRDLERNDIPYFSCKSTENFFVDSDGNPIDVPILKTGYDCFQDNLRFNLNTRDLNIQKIIISNSFEAVKLNKIKNKEYLPESINWSQSPLSLELIREKALARAKKELDKLSETYLINAEFIFWPSIDFSETINSWVSEFTSIYLYNGISGIALSFAYGARVFNEKNYLKIAQHCVNSIDQMIQEYGIKLFNSVGAFEGLGSLIYCYSTLYRLWPDQAIKDSLLHLVNFIPELLEKKEEVDIIDGSAGLLIVLLSLQDIVEVNALITNIKLSVSHILKHYPDPEELNLKNKDTETQPLLGFAHGVAGIIWALAKYYHLDPDPAVKQWIERGLAYERKYFNAKVGNWPDFRIFDGVVNKQANYMTAWCHGAAGIGLSRLAMAQHWHDPQLDQEIQAALKNTAQKGFSKYNCLCHGNLGNLELFLTAMQHYYDDTSLKQQYQQIAATILGAMEDDSFQYDLPSNIGSPGLMTGRAGGVYQLLRIADPELVPSILLLDPVKGKRFKSA